MKMFPSSGACRFWHSSCVNTAGIRQTSICESCWKDAGRIARVGGLLRHEILCRRMVDHDGRRTLLGLKQEPRCQAYTNVFFGMEQRK